MNSSAFLTYIAFTTWNIGLMWFLMTLGAGIYRGLIITRRNQQKVAELAKVHQRCKVLRDGTWKEVDVSEIVPWKVEKLAVFCGLPKISETSFASFLAFLGSCFLFETLRWTWRITGLLCLSMLISKKSGAALYLG